MRKENRKRDRKDYERNGQLRWLWRMEQKDGEDRDY
jgi:hypothetical protein